MGAISRSQAGAIHSGLSAVDYMQGATYKALYIQANPSAAHDYNYH